MDFSFLSGTSLFQGVREPEIQEALQCMKAREKTFHKEEAIWRAGDTVSEIGLVESGSVNIVVNYYWGGTSLFSHIEKGMIFGENYAAIPGMEMPCDVIAAEESGVLFLNMDQLLTTCANGCAFHNRIIHNLLRISAMKNLSLSARMMHTAPKSIRERLLSYLSERAMEQGSARFTVPFSRQQLADYLGVDRSALSAALSKMQKDGLITYRKNDFLLNVCDGKPLKLR